MKLGAMALTPEVTSVPNMMAFTGPLETVLPQLKEYGYSGVEFITIDPKKCDSTNINQLLDRLEIEPIAINTGPLNRIAGFSLSDPIPDKRLAAVKRMKEIIDFASIWTIPINCGVIRGQFLPNIPKEQTESLLLESLKELCDYSMKFNIRIAMETVPYTMTNFINTLAEAKTLISKIDCTNLGLMYDLTNMYIEEKDLYTSMRQYSKDCYHVHFADSNRLAPGDGGMDYKKIIDVLHEIRYEGYCVVELRPHPNQEIVTKRAADFLLPLLG